MFAGFGETWELQKDGTYKLIKITRIQCAICGEFGWREADDTWIKKHTNCKHKDGVLNENNRDS